MPQIAVLNQQPGSIQMSAHDCAMKSRNSRLIRRVWRCARVEQYANYINVAAAGLCDQRGRALPGLLIHIRAVFEQ